MNIIFDIDGVLADPSHRLHFLDSDLTDKWDRFYGAVIDDKPIWQTVKLLDTMLIHGHSIWLVTGRRLSTKNDTETWLNANLMYGPGLDSIKGIIYRKDGDWRKAVEYKEGVLSDINKTHPIYMAFEDDPDVVAMYRSKGIVCMQAADRNSEKL